MNFFNNVLPGHASCFILFRFSSPHENKNLQWHLEAKLKLVSGENLYVMRMLANNIKNPKKLVSLWAGASRSGGNCRVKFSGIPFFFNKRPLSLRVNGEQIKQGLHVTSWMGRRKRLITQKAPEESTKE